MAVPQLYGYFNEPGTDWQNRANCIGMDPDLFFPERHNAEECYKQTRPVCAACVVREDCLEYALQNRQDAGMWGGMTHNELRRERKRRGISVSREKEIDYG